MDLSKLTLPKHHSDVTMENVAEFHDPNADYSHAVNSVEFAHWNMPCEQGISSLLATSHVDGRVDIYKFSNYDELAEKQS